MISVKDITSKKEERDGIVYIDVLDCEKFRLTGLPWKNSSATRNCGGAFRWNGMRRRIAAFLR